MKPRSGKLGRVARAQTPQPAKRRRGLPPRLLGVASYLVVAALVAGLARYDYVRRYRSAAAALSPEAAGARGEALVKEERPLESLPFLRRELEGGEGARWQGHLQFASVLGALSIRVVTRAGIEQPLARSSIERVAIAREAEREYSRAWDLAPAGEPRATVASLYAEHLFAWGRVFEAFVMLRSAQDEAPGDKRRSERADLFQIMLEHPERFKTTQELMPAAPDSR
jgi:ribosomal protein S30